MDAFEKWADNYAPRSRVESEDAFRAGMRAAAERLTELMPGQQTAYVLRNAILAEADK